MTFDEMLYILGPTLAASMWVCALIWLAEYKRKLRAQSEEGGKKEA